MSKITKKIASVGVSLTTAIWLSGATMIPLAGAATTAELEAQIADLLAKLKVLQDQVSTAKGTTASSYNFTANLTLGSKGDDVMALQKFLNANGYAVAASGAGSAGNETKYFGPATKAALAKYQAAKGISPAVGYFGPKTRAAANATAGTTTTTTGTTTTTTGTTTTVVPSGFSIALASDNPAGATVPQGASGVAVLKFNVAGTGTLDTLTFKRIGIGAAGDFISSGIYLYEGAARLTSGKTINSTTHEIQFASLGLKVEGTRDLTLIASISSGATAANISAFQLTGATGTPKPTFGSVSGNSFSIGGQDVGGVEIAGGATPTNPKIGQVAAKLSEFTLTASSTEDIEISKIALTEGGTVTNDYLTNFVLKQGGNTLATAAKIGSKDLLTFALATPFKIEKGQQRTFEVYGDVGGLTRADDTIGFYLDNIADLSGKGYLYSYPINPNIAGTFDAVGDRQLTIQGGQITITFNGPVAGDVSLRGQDVTIYDFSIASQNNIEIKNLRFHATTTSLTSGDGFNDMKVWDVTANTVITSATDITTSTDQTFTDTLNISAGQTKRMKVTVDIDADNEDSDDITISLLVFNSTDIKNLDNNTNVTPSSSVVPNSTISGNVQDTRVPTLDTQLAATPSSQTYVRGESDKSLVGISFRATGGNVRLDQVKISAGATSGTLTSGEVTTLKLYDGATQIGDTKSLASDTDLTATFTGLNQTILSGTTKIYILKGNVDSNAGADDIYYFSATSTSANIVIYDKDGNSATLSGTSPNSGGNTVTITIKSTGDVTVVKAPDDDDSKTGIILAGKEQTLGKFKFSSTNEAMAVTKLQILVVTSSSATATSNTAADSVPTIKLYDGATQIGASGGYPINGYGNIAGVVVIDIPVSVSAPDGIFRIPKDGSKTITIKGVLNTIAQGADTGENIYASVMTQAVDGSTTYTFEAQGASAKDTTITAATGNNKIVYKSKPTLSVVTATPTSITVPAGAVKIAKFRVASDSAGQIWWKKIQFRTVMTDASITSVSTSTVKLWRGSTQLTLASVYTGVNTASGTTVNIRGGDTAYLGLEISGTGESISAGSYSDYDLELNFADVSTASGASPKLNFSIYRQEGSAVNATWYGSSDSGVIANGTTTGGGNEIVDQNMNPSFIWSDDSNTSHTTSTADWANAYLLDGF